MSQVNLIAVVANGGNIGPEGGPLEFLDRDEAAEWSEWFMEMTEGGIVVVGTNTLKMMAKQGWTGPHGKTVYTCWSRNLKMQPEEFIDRLKQDGRPIFIAGGQKTYELFAPFADMMFIKRTQAASHRHHTMPDLFGVKTLH